MIIINLPDRRIGLVFKHRQFRKPVLDPQTCKKFMNGITHCEIYKIAGEDIKKSASLLAVGIGICKWNDAFNKRIGRKASLTSVLNKTIGGDPKAEKVFSRRERERIWTAFWASCESQPAPPSSQTPPLLPVLDAETIHAMERMDGEGPTPQIMAEYGADINGNAITGP